MKLKGAERSAISHHLVISQSSFHEIDRELYTLVKGLLRMEIKMTIGEGKQLLSDSNSELEHTKAAKPESREPQGPEHKVIGIDMK